MAIIPGDWLPGSSWLRSKWSTFYSPSLYLLLLYQPSFRCYACHSALRTSSRRSVFFHVSSSSTSILLPPDSVPVDVTSTPNSSLRAGSAGYRPARYRLFHSLLKTMSITSPIGTSPLSMTSISQILTFFYSPFVPVHLFCFAPTVVRSTSKVLMVQSSPQTIASLPNFPAKPTAQTQGPSEWKVMDSLQTFASYTILCSSFLFLGPLRP
jgi:hypothetical protein